MSQAVREPRKLIPAAEVFAEWQKDPAYREAYAALEDEFAIMAALIRARTAAGLTQGEVAERMQTTQPAVARLEGQAHRASLRTLRGYAEATGHRVVIRLEQVGGEGVRTDASPAIDDAEVSTARCCGLR